MLEMKLVHSEWLCCDFNYIGWIWSNRIICILNDRHDNKGSLAIFWMHSSLRQIHALAAPIFQSLQLLMDWSMTQLCGLVGFSIRIELSNSIHCGLKGLNSLNYSGHAWEDGRNSIYCLAIASTLGLWLNNKKAWCMVASEMWPSCWPLKSEY